jgi:hypothetical protein
VYSKNTENTKGIIDEETQIIQSQNENTNAIQYNRTEEQLYVDKFNSLYEKNVLAKEFENPDTKGKTPITEEQAVKIWEQFIMEIDGLAKYKTITKIEKKEILSNDFFNNFYSIKPQPVTFSDFTRLAWYIESKNEEEPFQFYLIGIDMYTGKVISGTIKGD